MTAPTGPPTMPLESSTGLPTPYPPLEERWADLDLLGERGKVTSP